ncbi:MAG: 4Fe-4S binding protein [Planctomycetes bacterium]|nr:4Fe-4S binding protein [Planctomycetota bacterium]
MTRPRRRRLHAWTVGRRVTALAFVALLALAAGGGPAWLTGSAAATRAFDLVPFVDPLAGIESMLATRAVTGTTVLGVALLLLAAVILGPVFCGWICPLGLLMDLNQAVRDRVLRRLRKRRPPAPNPPPSPALRSAVLAAVIVFALLAAAPIFQALSPINLLVRGLLFGSATGLIVLAVLLVVEWFRPRIWCRVACPLGALYGLVGRFGVFRVRINRAHVARSPCRQCTRDCPMGIRVLEEYVEGDRTWIDHSACIRCGACSDVCPRDVLSLGFRRRRTGPDAHPDSEDPGLEITVGGRACERIAG